MTEAKDGRAYVVYVATSRTRSERTGVKTHHKSIRLSDEDVDALRHGRAIICLNARDGLTLKYVDQKDS